MTSGSLASCTPGCYISPCWASSHPAPRWSFVCVPWAAVLCGTAHLSTHSDANIRAQNLHIYCVPITILLYRQAAHHCTNSYAACIQAYAIFIRYR